MIWRGTATAAYKVHQPAFGKFFNNDCHGFRRFVIFPKLIGQACIRINKCISVGGGGKLVQPGTDLLCSQGTIESYCGQVCMANGMPKSLHRLSGKSPAAGISDGARYKNRYIPVLFFQQFTNGIQGGFAVQGIKNRFNQKKIHASFRKPSRLVVIGIFELVKIYIPKTWVINTGAQ